MSLSPDDQLSMARAKAYRRDWSGEGSLERAEICYKDVAACSSKDWSGHYGLGELKWFLSIRSDFKDPALCSEAVRCLETAIEKEPYALEPRLKFARLLSDRHAPVCDIDRAAEQYLYALTKAHVGAIPCMYDKEWLALDHWEIGCAFGGVKPTPGNYEVNESRTRIARSAFARAISLNPKKFVSEWTPTSEEVRQIRDEVVRDMERTRTSRDQRLETVPEYWIKADEVGDKPDSRMVLKSEAAPIACVANALYDFKTRAFKWPVFLFTPWKKDPPDGPVIHIFSAGSETFAEVNEALLNKLTLVASQGVKALNQVASALHAPDRFPAYRLRDLDFQTALALLDVSREYEGRIGDDYSSLRDLIVMEATERVRFLHGYEAVPDKKELYELRCRRTGIMGIEPADLHDKPDSTEKAVCEFQLQPKYSDLDFDLGDDQIVEDEPVRARESVAPQRQSPNRNQRPFRLASNSIAKTVASASRRNPNGSA